MTRTRTCRLASQFVVAPLYAQLVAIAPSLSATLSFIDANLHAWQRVADASTGGGGAAADRGSPPSAGGARHTARGSSVESHHRASAVVQPAS